MKLAICLQYHEADRVRAYELAAMIAANEPKFRDDVILCLVNRWDCPTAPAEVVAPLELKFHVEQFTTTTRAAGWPAGCNAMARDVLRHAAQEWRFGAWHAVTGVMLLEPDCIPIARDWIDQVKKEWHAAYVDLKWLMGTWRDGGGDLGHINGNCVVVPDFIFKVDMTNMFEWLAWDCAISPQVHTHWRVTDLICNRWKETGLTDETITTHRSGVGQPVLVHGVKDNSVWDYARRTLCP